MKMRKYGQVKSFSIEELSQKFTTLSYVKTALLFGSRSNGKHNPKSDYDFALEMESTKEVSWGMQAKVWMDICDLLSLKEDDVDIVDLTHADPYVKKAILENNTLIKGVENDISRLLS